MNIIRQKPANQQAVQKLEGFVISLKGTLDKGEPPNFSARQSKYGVSSSTTSACKALGIIKKEGNKYVFKSEETPGTIALLILDYFLKQNKKTMRGDVIPNFEALTRTLGNIVEKLTLLTVQNEVGLKRLKQGNTAPETSDLFRVDDQRLYLAGQIAAGIYDRVFPFVLNPSDGASIQETNRMIVEATDDLLLQLRAKPKE